MHRTKRSWLSNGYGSQRLCKQIESHKWTKCQNVNVTKKKNKQEWNKKKCHHFFAACKSEHGHIFSLDEKWKICTWNDVQHAMITSTSSVIGKHLGWQLGFSVCFGKRENVILSMPRANRCQSKTFLHVEWGF